MQVNTETLHEKIQRWEGLKRLYGELSLDEEYQLEAYKMLLQFIKNGVKEDARAKCHCNCQFWHYDYSREQYICNNCLGVKAHV